MKTVMSKAKWIEVGTETGWLDEIRASAAVSLEKQAATDRSNLIDIVMSYGEDKVAQALKVPVAQAKASVGKLSDDNLRKLSDNLREMLKSPAVETKDTGLSETPLQQAASLGWTLEKRSDEAASLSV